MPDSNKAPWNGEDRRKSEREDFVRSVVCAIREEALIGGVDSEAHREQHAFLAEWIEELRRKRERREKIKTQVMGWGIVTALGAVGTGAVHAFNFLREHWK